MYSDKSQRSAIYEPRPRHGCVFIVGGVHCGKTEFAAALSARTGLPIGETGEIIMENLAAQLTSMADTGLLGPRPYTEWLDIMRMGKDPWRASLVSLGNLMTGIRGDALIDPLLRRGARIVTGVRRHVEVEARLAQGCRDVWITVVRPGFVSPPDSYELQELHKLLPGGMIHFNVSEGRIGFARVADSIADHVLAEINGKG